MLAIDLCCGLGGWTTGLLAAGWDVIGFDVTAWPDYPAPRVLQDIRTVDGRRLAGAALIVASPPCTEFSRRDLPWTRATAPEPDLSLVEACRRIAREAGAPLVMENVRGAIPYLGRPQLRYRRRYLWGDGVPPLIWPSPPNSHKESVCGGPLRSMLRAKIEPELALWVAHYNAGGAAAAGLPAEEEGGDE